MIGRKPHCLGPSYILGRCLHAIILVSLVGAQCEIFTGDPPTFSGHPEDQFVFNVDENGNPVTLTLTCPVTGSAPLTIQWYRSGVLDEEFKMGDGSYVFPNINETHVDYANGEGVEYYCTAENCLGTIRSPTVKAFYAAFTGFVSDVPETQRIDVIDSDVSGHDQTVALECALNPGSNPKPNIEWLIVDSEGTETVLVEDSSRVHFVDDGEWLILETDTEAITGKTYFCRVTNKDYFQTEQAPTNYTLNPVTEFADLPGYTRVYKSLTNKTVPKVDFLSAQDDDKVLFGTGMAYNGFYVREWTVNGGINRVTPNGAVALITPSILHDDDRNPLEVRLGVDPLPESGVELVAYLLLLEPAVIISHGSDMRDVLTGTEVEFTCVTSGSPPPDITWFFNGEQLEGDERRMIDGGTLTIPSSMPEDSGMYQCLAENPSGSQSASWTAQIRNPDKPIITSSYEVDPSPSIKIPVIQQAAGPVELTVQLSADPCPSVEWKFDGIALTAEDALPEDNVTRYTFTDGCEGYTLGDTQFTFKLTVNVLNEETIGFYDVTFSNEGGSTSIPTHLVTTGVFAGFEGDPEIRPIDVIDADISERDQSVALRCALKPGSIPIPTIEWVVSTGGAEPVLMEDTSTHRVRFLDKNEWLILHTSSDAIVDKEYFCRVRFPDDEMWVVLTNTDGELQHHVASDEDSSIRYTLNSVSSFPDGVMVYKNLSDRRAPRQDVALAEVPESDRVLFGTAFATSDEYIRQWRINMGEHDPRLRDMGTIVSVAPVFLDDDLTNPLVITLHLVPENSSLQTVELNAYFLLEYQPILTKPPRATTNRLTGESVSFTCEADGGPLPTFSWTFQGASFAGDDQRIVNGGTLNIPSVSLEHSGVYSCVASNGVGAPASASATLNVRQSMAINITSSYQTDPHPCSGIPEITETQLVVDLMADPCPTAEWRLNGVLITAETENITIKDGCARFKVGDTKFSHKLTVTVLNEATEGEYSVTFTNPNGSVTIPPHRLANRVNPTITGLVLEPDITVAGSDEHCLTLGTTSTMTCSYNAFPHGTVTFLKNSAAVALDGRITQSCGVLMITGVIEEDAGLYQCKVQNDVAEATSLHLNLVHCAHPVFVMELQFVNNKPRLNTQAKATCQWSGVPKPTLAWSKNGNSLSTRGRFTIEESVVGSDVYRSELKIQSLTLTDSGTYSCSINNIVGSESSSKVLEVMQSSASRLHMGPIGVMITAGISLVAIYITQGI